MKNAIKALLNVFPELHEAEIKPDLTLGAIPGWDSMNVINLQLELEALCKVDLSAENISGDMTVDQLEDRIKMLSGR